MIARTSCLCFFMLISQGHTSDHEYHEWPRMTTNDHGWPRVRVHQNIMTSLFRHFIKLKLISPEIEHFWRFKKKWLKQNLEFCLLSPRAVPGQGGTGRNSANSSIPPAFLAFFRHKMLRNTIAFLPLLPSWKSHFPLLTSLLTVSELKKTILTRQK